ncbi:hypothetical protein BJ508DRAFT_380107 [Ascobolus immersus RN42]|uniref:DUF4219 domain-containing protein n=1 Tax=Ascobolus immersus RN42 TaxID=1160509 RepID=A0A3N4I0E8_ASCIM|nr:hypothetical protein BJ508DRAFT_380107 [Ascobolus immersus RN42]
MDATNSAENKSIDSIMLIAGIPQLRGSADHDNADTNFDAWKQRIMLVLQNEGLWELIENKDGENNTSTSKHDDHEDSEGDDSDYEDTEGNDSDCKGEDSSGNSIADRNRRALFLISLAMEDDQVKHIEKYTTVAEAWKALEKAHTDIKIHALTRGADPVLVLRRLRDELMNFTMSDSDTVAVNIGRQWDLLLRHIDRFDKVAKEFETLFAMFGHHPALNPASGAWEDDILELVVVDGFLMGAALLQSLEGIGQAWDLMLYQQMAKMKAGELKSYVAIRDSVRTSIVNKIAVNGRMRRMGELVRENDARIAMRDDEDFMDTPF